MGKHNLNESFSLALMAGWLASRHTNCLPGLVGDKDGDDVVDDDGDAFFTSIDGVGVSSGAIETGVNCTENMRRVDRDTRRQTNKQTIAFKRHKC